jgi:hypothetical protein
MEAALLRSLQRPLQMLHCYAGSVDTHVFRTGLWCVRVKHGESNIEEEEGLWNIYVIMLLKLFGILL